MIFNRETFFDRFRQSFGKVIQLQVDGLNFLLDKLEKDTFSLEQAAYVLATVKHETAGTFQPIKEYRARVGSKIRKIQDRYWGSDYFGRGYVMITWRANYEKFGIADDPDKALEPETAYHILSRGMREGMFTKYKLSDFVNGDVDYHNARKVINGLDKASEIAEMAEKLERVLKASLVTKPVTEQPKEIVSPPKSDTPNPAGAEKKESVAETVPGPPSQVEVKAPPTSLASKIAAAAAPVGTALTALGIKIGGIHLSENTIIALCAVFVVSFIVGAVLWDRSQTRRWQRQELGMKNLADPTKGNAVASQG